MPARFCVYDLSRGGRDLSGHGVAVAGAGSVRRGRTGCLARPRGRARRARAHGHRRRVSRGPLVRRAGRRQDVAGSRRPDSAPARSRHRRPGVRGPRRAGAELRGGTVGVRHPAECRRAAGRVHHARGLELGRGPAVRVRRRRCRSRERTTSARSARSPRCSRRSSAARRGARGSCSSLRASASTCSARSSAAPARCSRRRIATSCRACRRPPRRRCSIACCRCRASPRIPRSPRRSSTASRTRKACCAPTSSSARWRCATCGSRTLAALQKARRPDRARGLVAARRVRRDRQRALGAAAVSRSSLREQPVPSPARASRGGSTSIGAFAQHAFNVLEQRGVIVRGDPEGTTWMLRHEVLQPARARAAPRRRVRPRGVRSTCSARRRASRAG